MKVTLLLQPPTRSIPFPSGPERYPRLAAELVRHLGMAVRVAYNDSPESITDGYLLWVTDGDPEHLLGGLRPSIASDLAARTVLIDVSWQKALAQLERYHFAAVVDSLRLSEWLARQSGTIGVFGLSRLASVIGASCSPLPSMKSRHYCLLEGERHQGMSQLLADYLRAYDEDRKPLSDFSAFDLVRTLPLENRKSVVTEMARTSLHPFSRFERERASIKRTIASLKHARVQARMTRRHLAKLTGIQPDILRRLEAGDIPSVPLGVLRAYSNAVKDTWGWRLAGVGEVRRPVGDVPGGRPRHDHLLVPGSHEEEMSNRGDMPPVLIERGGYTVPAMNRRMTHRMNEDPALAEAACQ